MLESATRPAPVLALATTGSRSRAWAAAVVGVLAAAVSVIGSWIPSLWGDEAASVLSATRPVASLLRMLTHVDAVHGTYYLGLHAWVSVFGDSPFSVRFPSAIAAGATAAAVVWLCGRFGSVRFAVVAGLIAAILPRLTLAGEEARSYAFDAAIATVICVVAVELARRPAPTRRVWIGYGTALAIGTYAFLYLVLMSLVVGLVLLLAGAPRARLRSWLITTAWAVLAAAPVIVAALIEHNQIAFLAHRDVVTPTTVLVQMWFGSLPLALIAWALIAVASAGLVADVVAARRADRPLGARLDVLALAWLVVPMGLLLAVSPLIPDFTSRYGTLAAPAAAVLMALGLRRLWRFARPIGARMAPSQATASGTRRTAMRGVAAAALVAVVVAAAPVWLSQRGPYSKNGSDWNEIAEVVHQNALPGDGILFDETSRPSLRPRLAMSTDPGAFRAVRDIALQTPYARSGTWYAHAYTPAQAAALGRFSGISRVWLVEYASGGTASRYGIATLTSIGYHAVERIDEHRSVVYLFVR